MKNILCKKLLFLFLTIFIYSCGTSTTEIVKVSTVNDSNSDIKEEKFNEKEKLDRQSDELNTQTVLTGYVMDQDKMENENSAVPVSYIKVYTNPPTDETFTDEQGKFELSSDDFLDEVYIVKLQGDGYVSKDAKIQKFNLNQVNKLNILLIKQEEDESFTPEGEIILPDDWMPELPKEDE